MKPSLLMAPVLVLANCVALADVQADAPYQLSGTVTLANNYLFKGMTQTWDQPALQGSLDLTSNVGLWGSLWASNVSDKVYAGAHAEIDLSAGYRRALSEDWTVGTGVMSVFYPGGNYSKVRYADFSSQRYDFTEAHVSISWRWLSAKYSYSLTDLLGFNEKTGYSGNTKGSTYLDLNADVPLAEAYTLNLHAGHQDVSANLLSPTVGGETNPDFWDYKLGVTRALVDGSLISLAGVWNSNRAFYDATSSNRNLDDRKDVGRPRLMLTYTKPFVF